MCRITYFPQELMWMQYHLDFAATGSGRVRTDDTTLIERVEPSFYDALGDRLPVHLTSSKITFPQHTRKVLAFRNRTQNKWRETQLPRQKEAEKLEFEA